MSHRKVRATVRTGTHKITNRVSRHGVSHAHAKNYTNLIVVAATLFILAAILIYFVGQ